MENLFFNIEPSELVSACGLPAKLHPASANALEHLLANDLPWEQTKAVGEGEDYRAESKQGDHASALAFEDTVIHGSVIAAV